MNESESNAVTDRPAPKRTGWAGASRWTATGVVLAILAAGAFTFNFAVASMDLRFRKIAMPLRQPIAAIDNEVGPWVKVNVDKRFPPDLEDALGTLDYIDRIYVDTRKADPKVLAEYRATEPMTDAMRFKLRSSVLANDPYGVLRLHVAYYTGGVDTVPHIPDRCMIGAGYETTGRQEIDLLTLPSGEPLRVSFAQFEERAAKAQPVRHNVAYVFKVNGEYEHDAITGVRLKLQDLRISHAYFAKIEVSATTTGMETERSKAAIADLLGHALPAIDESLPVWPPEDPEANVEPDLVETGAIAGEVGA